MPASDEEPFLCPYETVLDFEPKHLKSVLEKIFESEEVIETLFDGVAKFIDYNHGLCAGSGDELDYFIIHFFIKAVLHLSDNHIQPILDGRGSYLLTEAIMLGNGISLKAKLLAEFEQIN